MQETILHSLTIEALYLTFRSFKNLLMRLIKLLIRYFTDVLMRETIYRWIYIIQIHYPHLSMVLEMSIWLDFAKVRICM
jgi:hypothetical protein